MKTSGRKRPLELYLNLYLLATHQVQKQAKLKTVQIGPDLMSPETKTHQCHRKLRHADYFSAMLHARRLAEDGIVIYPCDVCGGLHLGHNRRRFEVHCERVGRAKVASLRRKIAKHILIARKHERIAQELECQLERVIILYDV